MSEVKISQLPSASLPLTGAEVFPLVQNGVTVQAPINSVSEETNTIATLKNLAIGSYSVVFVKGYHTVGDGGGGYFYSVTGAAAGTYVDNGGTIILPTGGNGSSAWLRIVEGPINVKWFGAIGDGTNNDTTSVNNAKSLGQPVYLQYTPNSYNVTNSVDGKLYGPGVINSNTVYNPTPPALRADQTVLMVRTPGQDNRWIVTAPDGFILNTDASTTSGLQEAINYAHDNGYDLHVIGGQSSSSRDYGLLYTTTSVVFPPMRCAKIHFEATHLICTPTNLSDDALVIDSCMIVDFYFHGEIAYYGSGNAVHFKPENGVPVDNLINVIDSRFFIHTAGCYTPSNAVIYFDTNYGPLSNSKYEFCEINSGETLPPFVIGSTYGVLISGSETSDYGFSTNFVSCPHIHGGTVPLQIGVSSVNSLRNNTNCFNVSLTSTVNGATGINNYGYQNVFTIGTVSVTGTATTAITQRVSALGNTYIVGSVYATGTTYVNNATVKTSNQIIVGKENVATSATLSGSPYTYQNTNLWPVMVTVSGGTLTANTQISVDGSTYYDMGLTTGQFMVPQGYYLQITYSVAPTVTLFA